MSSDDSFAPLDATEPYDVCIIGSGPSGMVLGGALVARGVRVLMLESGRGLRAWFTDRRIRSLARYDFTGDTDYPLTRTTSRVLGGNSNFWTGRCERFHPSDFERHAYTPPENPWPITYADLDSYYDRAEQLLRVRGGPRSGFCPPRRAPLPLPASPDISYLQRLGAVLGVTFEDSSTATPTKTLRFFKVHREILPAFLKSERITLVTGATVTRLLADADRRIVGAEVKGFDGTTKIARARYFVVSCGGIESPRVLLLSKSEQFPNGVGNSHDMVGRGFNEHPNVSFTGTLPHSWGTIVPTNKIARTHQYYSTYRAEGLGSVFPVMRQAWVLPNHIAKFRLSNVPGTMLKGLGRVFRAPFFVGAGTEMKISPANRVTLSPSRTDLFGSPIAHLIMNFSEEDRRLLDRARGLLRGWLSRLQVGSVRELEVAWSRHHQGACRMGLSPATSVVDADLRVHETPNLYVCGSEVFVTGGAMQPSLTIVALALRLADHLADRLRTAEPR
ncbi:MAG TPA: GMC family oxidoreductase [Gemmatimonadales bacterium]|nr:GMC family oxidoreductase [Gemmatimonadales bacterium]